MIQEFKDFINRGNVIELAVAVILGAAFGPVVTAVTDGVLMQIIAAAIGEPNFSSLTFGLGDAEIAYGLVITTVVNFVMVAFALFLIIKAYNATKAPEDELAAGPTEVELLTEIRDALTRR